MKFYQISDDKQYKLKLGDEVRYVDGSDLFPVFVCDGDAMYRVNGEPTLYKKELVYVAVSGWEPITQVQTPVTVGIGHDSRIHLYHNCNGTFANPHIDKNTADLAYPMYVVDDESLKEIQTLGQLVKYCRLKVIDEFNLEVEGPVCIYDNIGMARYYANHEPLQSLHNSVVVDKTKLAEAQRLYGVFKDFCNSNNLKMFYNIETSRLKLVSDKLPNDWTYCSDSDVDEITVSVPSYDVSDIDGVGCYYEDNLVLSRKYYAK